MLTIDLTDKVALVLGGSRGIGAGITAALCKAGAATTFTHTGNPQHADRVQSFVAELWMEGCDVTAEVVDGRDAAATTDLINRVAAARGKIDVLVSNVGKNKVRPAEQATDQEWRDYIDLNLSTAFYGVRAVLPHMLSAGSGRIILIGSSAAYDGGGGAIDYATGKAGLDGMMLYLTRNYARKGILTNVIHPCVIDTDLLRERYSDEDKRRALAGQVPAGRLGTPEDIGGFAAYLASSWGSFICGQSFLIDGGRTMFR